MATKKFDLRKLIIEVAEQSDTANPNALAAEVLSTVPREQRMEALSQALPFAVREIVVRQRTPTNELGSGYRGRMPQPSRKVTNIRNNWQKILHERHKVGPNGTWKLLGDCTADELDWAAELRDRMALQNALKAEQFRKFAKLLRENQVATLRELPETVLGDEK